MPSRPVCCSPCAGWSGHPHRRRELGSGPDELAGRIAGIHAAHGPDALGFYLSGQLLTEDYYVFNKLVKGLLGTNNLDTNSRLCMSSAVAGYKATLGADAPPACYEDMSLAGCMFITGSNMAWAHPISVRRVEEARRAIRSSGSSWPTRAVPRPQAGRSLSAVAAGQRCDAVSRSAAHHAVGGLDGQRLHRAAHQRLCTLKELVREATPEKVAAICGLPVADLYRAARWMALGGAEERRTRRPRSACTARA
jgi:assimilatory nitrate reductase catalytic subunit